MVLNRSSVGSALGSRCTRSRLLKAPSDANNFLKNISLLSYPLCQRINLIELIFYLGCKSDKVNC